MLNVETGLKRGNGCVTFPIMLENDTTVVGCLRRIETQIVSFICVSAFPFQQCF
jgi:hypothetical protein